MSVDVDILGIGTTKFEVNMNKTFPELIIEAAQNAVHSTLSEFDFSDIDGLVVSVNRPDLVNQEHAGYLASQFLGIKPSVISRVEMGSASGAVALRTAISYIKSGLASVVLVIGIEKFPILTNDTIYDDSEVLQGFVQIAKEHQKKYGTSGNELSEVALKNLRNGIKNKNSYIYGRNVLDEEKVRNAPFLSDPLKTSDRAVFASGASAVILSHSDYAQKYCEQPVKILGMGQEIDTILNYPHLNQINEFTSMKRASKMAYQMAEITPGDIDVAEVHDTYTIGEIIAYEDLGFTKKGMGGKFVTDGETLLSGSLPVNPSGGIIGRGNVWGANGVVQIVEIVNQIRGKAGKRQIADVEIGLAQSQSGLGNHQIVHILGI